MKLQIKRPEWTTFVGIPDKYSDTLDDWFLENVEPINKILSEGEDVTFARGKDWVKSKALLIEIPVELEGKDD